MLISERMGMEPCDIFDGWVERVDTARAVQHVIHGILPEGRAEINGVTVEVRVQGDYYWLTINNRKINAWHKGFVERHGLMGLAWEMAKSYALTWRSVRG